MAVLLPACSAFSHKVYTVSTPALAVTTDTLTPTSGEERLIPLPKIPAKITDPTQRARYFVSHYWDDWKATAESFTPNEAALEQTTVDFLAVLHAVRSTEEFPAEQYVLAPLRASNERVVVSLLNLYRKYLHESASPFRDDELFLAVALWAATDKSVPFATQVRMKENALLLSRNRVGHPAEDFPFVSAGAPDSLRSLSQLRGKHPTILFFYSPGCDHCSAALYKLQYCAPLREALRNKAINLLLVYNGYGKGEWLNYREQVPNFGENVYNVGDTILNTPLYDLSQSPTILLLDPQGKVRLKNASVDELIRELYH